MKLEVLLYSRVTHKGSGGDVYMFVCIYVYMLAPGGSRGGFKGPSRELLERWGDLGKVPGGAEEAMRDLSLCFPMFGGHRAL